jgi:xylulokinase
VTKECLQKTGISGENIEAVGVSGMVPTIILVNEKGELLRLSIQQNDARSFEEIKEFKDRVDENEILKKTGSPISQQSVGPKLLWLRRYEPEVMKSIAHIMGSYDYIVYKLTGSFSCERNWALESGLFDLYKDDWDNDLLSLSQIERSFLGKVYWPSDVVGEVNSQAAEHTGLKKGTAVVAGSADHIASAFSAGVKNQGDLLIKLGGAGDILYALDRPIVDSRLFLDYHVIPSKFLINGCMAASGSIIKWFKNNFFSQNEYSYLDKEVMTIPSGSEGLILLPYFLGEKTPINDPLARGVIFGLNLSHSWKHIYRAILEGISFGFKHHIAVLQEHDLPIKKTRVTNGGARSILWKQITSDILGIQLEEVANHPGSSLGAAFIAGMGIGKFKEWNEIERFIKISSIIIPNMEANKQYQELYLIYRALYESLKDKFPMLQKAIGGK